MRRLPIFRAEDPEGGRLLPLAEIPGRGRAPGRVRQLRAGRGGGPRPTGPEGRKGRDLDRLNLHLAANGDCWAEPDGRHLEPERREVDGDGLLHYGFPLLEPRDAKPSRMVAFTVGLMGDEAGKALFEEGASEACRRLSPSRVLAFGTPHGFDAHGAEVAWYESSMQARFRKMREAKKADRKEVEHGTRKR